VPPEALTDNSDGRVHLDVSHWRFGQLKAAGYPVEVAILLAERLDVDLHLACTLLEQGATVQQALEIVT